MSQVPSGRLSATSRGTRSRKSDLSTYAYESIRAAIVGLTLHPGDLLRETALAEQLQVSRTPVRAALRRLESDGYITPDPVRGYVVAQISVQDVENAYEVIEVLEGLASRLAALRRNDDDITTLQSLTESLANAAASGDLEAWVDADDRFHKCIREIAQNPTLNHLSQLPYSIIERVRHMHMREKRDPERMAVETESHQQIALAIAEGNGERAEVLTRDLFRRATAANIELLRQWVLPLRRTF